MLTDIQGRELTPARMREIRRGAGLELHVARDTGTACAADRDTAANFYTRADLCCWCGLSRYFHRPRRENEKRIPIYGRT